MATKAQYQVQLRRADFQQQVGVAGKAGDQAAVRFTDIQHDGRLQRHRRGDHCRRREAGALGIGGLGQLACGQHNHRHEAHLVAGLELAELPQIGLDDGHRADEAAQARAVRTEDHRHIAGEVHRADGVGVVMDIGWMQAGLAAALAHPLGFRADQAHPGAAGVEVHFPVGGEEARDVALGEVFRRAVRTVDHPQLAHRRQGAAQLGGERGTGRRVAQRCQVQHVAGAQGTATVAAELAEGKGALAAQILRHLHPAAHGQVGAGTGAGDGADGQGAAGRDENGGAHRLRDVIELHGDRGTGDRHHCIGVEAQDRPAHGDFQPGSVLGVVQRALPRRSARLSIGPDGGTPTPVAEAAGEVLHGGLGAGADHLEGVGRIAQTFQAAGPGRAEGEGAKPRIWRR